MYLPDCGGNGLLGKSTWMAFAEASDFLSPALFKADFGKGAIGNWIGGDPPAGLGATVRSRMGTDDPKTAEMN